MKIEDLQRKLGTSRTTLYRYMKGINQITPELAQQFVSALNMDIQQSLEFARLISQSAFDHSLIESRYVIDEFLFGENRGPNPVVDVDMVYYDNDKYLRTLREVLSHISSFSEKDKPHGIVKIYNCLSENIFVQFAELLEKAFAAGADIDVEHFVGLSETDYLQNTYSFVSIFPLMKYEKYRLYFRESEADTGLMHDSMLVSIEFADDGKQIRKFFSLSFYESGMPECVAFGDSYMYSYLSKSYENLKLSFKNVMKKYEGVDFSDDIFFEMQKRGSSCMIKPNPCYDKIPLEAYLSLLERISADEMQKLLSSLFGKKVAPEDIPALLDYVGIYLRKRIDSARTSRRKDVYSMQGLIEFKETGMLTDHLEYLPPFSPEETRMVFESLYERCNDPETGYELLITEQELSRKDLVLDVCGGFGILVEYIYPSQKEGLWKMILIESERLASILSDYCENYLPLNHVMEKEDANKFLLSLME